MGGEHKECGCYDGPLSADMPANVSVRCKEHRFSLPAQSGHTLMTIDANGHAVFLPYLSRPRKMAIPKGRQRRHR